MAGRSSFLPRLSFSRGGGGDGGYGPGLPFHNPASPPIRKKPSEYDLSDLSPPRPSTRTEDGLLSPETWRNRNKSSSSSERRRRSSSPVTTTTSVLTGSRVSDAGSASKAKRPNNNSRILFNGPPPPIATSRMLYYRDEEEEAGGGSESQRLDASTIARGIGSMFIDRSSPSHARTASGPRDYEPDTVWRTLQRRERTLQKELQRLLDAQSVGLAGNFGEAGSASASAGASDAGSNTPTGTSLYNSTLSAAASHKHVAFAQETTVGPSGEVIPVRQPKQRPIPLSEARAGLGRYISLLADLKAEEDATLASALSARKKALAQLRKFSSQQQDIQEELRSLEEDKDEPLAMELRDLSEERSSVTEEIAELEERLIGLRNRKRWLDAKVDDVRNRREAGLSGYRGALKEVEGKVGAILRRPGVRPLDLEVVASGQGEEGEEIPVGGAEFLRLKPERRTAEMAKEWWEGEVALLEKRKEAVDRDRKALEEGVQVWKAAVGIVAGYERGLDRDIKGSKEVEKTPEEAIHGQLVKIREVSEALEEKYKIAEDKSWNLLICAIGAELGAYKLADELLTKTLKDMGVEVDEPKEENLMDDSNGEDTPQLGRSTNMKDSGARLDASLAFASDDNPGKHRVAGGHQGDLVDLHRDDEEDDRRTIEESDNEVPPDLLVSAGSPAPSRESSSLSENEVPPEFLVEPA